MNHLAQNVYALTRDERFAQTDTLTASELISLEQLAAFRQSDSAALSHAWSDMAENYGWYPVIDELQDDSKDA